MSGEEKAIIFCVPEDCLFDTVDKSMAIFPNDAVSFMVSEHDYLLLETKCKQLEAERDESWQDSKDWQTALWKSEHENKELKAWKSEHENKELKASNKDLALARLAAESDQNTLDEANIRLNVEVKVLQDALSGILEEPWSMSNDPSLRSGYIAREALNKAKEIRGSE